MHHEFLNGDAMKEIIKDDSIELFILYPPFLGVDTVRYGSPDGQINKINDTIIFAKKMAKVVKNCEKALKKHGSIILALPMFDPELLGLMYKYIKKKTKLKYVTTLIWNYRHEQYSPKDRVMAESCNLLWLSKDTTDVNMDFILKNPNGILDYPWDQNYLVEKYGQMGHVLDSMPEELNEHLIEMITSPGDTVADVFGGAGTVSIAAEKTGRNSVYNDISYVQLTIAKRRMEDLIASKKKEKFRSEDED